VATDLTPDELVRGVAELLAELYVPVMADGTTLSGKAASTWTLLRSGLHIHQWLPPDDYEDAIRKVLGMPPIKDDDPLNYEEMREGLAP
jgi:hypothetical protein